MKHVEIIVNDLLHENPETRDSDDLLFCEFLKTVDYDDFTEIAEQIKCKKIMSQFKSVARARRRLQENNPMLWGTKRIERMKAQEEFVEYAREENC